MRGIVSFCLAAVLVVGAALVSENRAEAQCNVQQSSAAASANSAALLQNQAIAQFLAQRATVSSAFVAPPPRIVSVQAVQSPVGASATATAGSFAQPANVDALALAQALATLQQAASVNQLATAQAVGSCNVGGGGRSRSLSVSRAAAAPLARIVSLAQPRSVNVARSRSVTR